MRSRHRGFASGRSNILSARVSAIIALIGSLPLGLAAAAEPASPVATPQQVDLLPGISRWDMPSKISGRTYRVQIFRPLLPPPPGGYPVFYVTDGYPNFNVAADQMRVREYADLRPAIIVGIGYPTDELWAPIRLRMKDFLPTRPTAAFRPTFDSWGKFVDATVDDSGGAEAFYRFITEELRPRLVASYSVDASDQSLFGHSLGGLFVLHVLLNHPQSFRSYIASSASILYNDREIITRVPAFKTAVEHGDVRPRVMLTIGGLETYPSAADLAAMAPADVLRQARQGGAIPNTIEMSERLSQIQGAAGYVVKSHIFEGENHGSVMPASISRALTFSLARGQPGP